MPNFGELTKVFEAARTLAGQPGCDYSWTSWLDSDDALSDIDSILAELSATRLPAAAEVVFLPTGPLQELALSSGWGDRFLKLASWYDEAALGTDCECYEGEVRGEETHLGMDDRCGEASIAVCPRCGVTWLRYRYEMEAVTGSGRWFLGPLPRLNRIVVNASTARSILEALPWYFSGGSYFGGKVQRSSREIQL